MIRTILIIGATGKQGADLVKMLSKTAYRVRCLVRVAASNAARSLQLTGAAVCQSDLSIQEWISNAIGNAKTMFLVSPPAPNVEVEYAENVIAACLKAGIEHIIYSSVARKELGSHGSLSLLDNYTARIFHARLLPP